MSSHPYPMHPLPTGQPINWSTNESLRFRRLSLAAPNRRGGERQRPEAKAVGRRLGHRGEGDCSGPRIPVDRPEAGVRERAVAVAEIRDIEAEDIADILAAVEQ